MSETPADVSFKELFRFFIPLSVTITIIAVTHNIINSALARLPSPELNIAVYSVVKSLFQIVKSPIMISRHAFISLVGDEETFILTKKYLRTTGFIIFSILFLFAYTPLGGWILETIIGLKNSQIPLSYTIMRIMCFIPLVEIWRNENQSLIVCLKKTKLFIPGVILRLIFLSLFSWWVVSSHIVSGAVTGSLAVLIGIGIEGIFAYLAIRFIYKSQIKAVEQITNRPQLPLSVKRYIKFFLPLGLMMSLAALIQPIIQSGIARGELPTLSLAAFGVAWYLLYLMTGSLANLSQCSLVYTDDIGDKNWQTVFRFALLIGSGISVLVFIFSLSPFGFWVIHNLIGVSNEVTELIRQTLAAFSLYPIIRALREVYWGILMGKQNTNIIGLAKSINIAVVIIFLIIGLWLLPLNAAIIGAFAFTIGETVETILIWRYSVSTSHPAPWPTKTKKS